MGINSHAELIYFWLWLEHLKRDIAPETELLVGFLKGAPPIILWEVYPGEPQLAYVDDVTGYQRPLRNQGDVDGEHK